MPRLVGNVTFGYSNCEHTSSMKGVTREEAAGIAKYKHEKQLGLCGSCYAKHCEKNNIVPWYSR